MQENLLHLFPWIPARESGIVWRSIVQTLQLLFFSLMRYVVIVGLLGDRRQVSAQGMLQVLWRKGRPRAVHRRFTRGWLIFAEDRRDRAKKV